MTTLCFNSVPMDLVSDRTGEQKLTPKVKREKTEKVLTSDKHIPSYRTISDQVNFLINPIVNFEVTF